MKTYYENLDKVLYFNNLDKHSAILIGNHLIAKCNRSDKWKICHYENNFLDECKEYDNKIAVFNMVMKLSKEMIL